MSSTTTLPLEVFSQRNFVANFIQLKLTFIPKKEKFAFWATLWGLWGNVRTTHFINSSFESPCTTTYSS